MQFSLTALLALPLLAAAGPMLDERGILTVANARPNFYHGKPVSDLPYRLTFTLGDRGNCSGYDYKRCKDQVLNPLFSFVNAPKRQWYQCWATPSKAADCYVWDGEF
ncbi:Deoxyribodipyrimidine photo-lyase [Venturia nashicola]|uniref:Deoxyribodipyrimidine photo-lyase n=1 Tax=Venturia nashicola TaxID=86259 RepID=A0A4Z1PQG1_9PEZI|nr:Deoxyribodipyrimidine photo-lyase [Venturia nashicola]